MDYIYEAAPLRYMPNAITGEFANVGVLVVARHITNTSDVEVSFELPKSHTRIKDFFRSDYEGPAFRFIRDLVLSSSKRAFKEAINQTGLGAFRWGNTITGVAENAAAAVEELLYELVTCNNEISHKSESISNQRHWEIHETNIRDAVESTGASDKFNYQFVITKDITPVHLHWMDKSARHNILEPVSFVCRADGWADKVLNFSGHMNILEKWQIPILPTVLLLEPTDKKDKQSSRYQNCLDNLKISIPGGQVILPEDIDKFIAQAAQNAA
jgi:hypothetical protein